MQLAVAVQIATRNRIPAVRLNVVGVFLHASQRASFARGALLIETALELAIFVPLEERLEQRFFGKVGAMRVIVNPRAARISVAFLEEAMNGFFELVAVFLLESLREGRPPRWQIGQLILKAADDRVAKMLWQPPLEFAMNGVEMSNTNIPPGRSTRAASATVTCGSVNEVAP